MTYPEIVRALENMSEDSCIEIGSIMIARYRYDTYRTELYNRGINLDDAASVIFYRQKTE